MHRIMISELTPKARACICNGVGPAFAQRLFSFAWVPWQRWEPNREFCEVAKQHDLDYWTGGGFVEKWAADDAFIAGCMQVVVLHRGWRKWALCALAQAYGLAVKSLLGWFAWHFGRRTEKEIEEVTDGGL